MASSTNRTRASLSGQGEGGEGAAARRGLRSASSEQQTPAENPNSGFNRRKQAQPLSRAEKEQQANNNKGRGTRVHAQRKFAQGQGSSANTTPTKIMRATPTPNLGGTHIPSSSSSSSSSTASGPTSKDPKSTGGAALPKTGERPKTEDFLTFLCLRGTNLLPPELDFFNQANVSNIVESSEEESSDPDAKLTGAVARKTVRRMSSKDEERLRNKLETRNLPASVQALKKKYVEQRLAKNVVSKTIAPTSSRNRSKSDQIGVTTRSNSLLTSTKTRSGRISRSQASSIIELKSRKPSAAALAARSKTRMATLRAASSSVSRMLTRLTPRGTSNAAFVKSTRKIPLASRSLRGRQISLSSEEESDDGKSMKKKTPPPRKLKSRKTLTKKNEESESDADEETSSRDSSKKRVDKLEKGKVAMLRKREARSVSRDSSASKDSNRSENGSKRPSRKTKEAATVYLNMLGQKMTSKRDDDAISIESLNEVTQEKRLSESIKKEKPRRIITPSIIKKQSDDEDGAKKKNKTSKDLNESKDKKRNKQSLKQLQDMLLEEAKKKIATSPLTTEKAESDNGDGEERFTISHKTGYIQVKPRKSTDQPLDDHNVINSAVVGPSGRRLSQNGERTLTPPRKILPKVEEGAAVSTTIPSHITVGVMGSSRISAPLKTSVVVNTSQIGQNQPQPIVAEVSQTQNSSVPLTQPLVIATNFNSGGDASKTQSDAIPISYPQSNTANVPLNAQSVMQNQGIRVPLQMGLVPVQVRPGTVVANQQTAIISGSNPNQIVPQTFSSDQIQNVPIVGTPGSLQIPGMQQITFPQGGILQPGSQTVIRTPYGFTQSLIAQPVTNPQNPQDITMQPSQNMQPGTPRPPYFTPQSIPNQQQRYIVPTNMPQMRKQEIITKAATSQPPVLTINQTSGNSSSSSATPTRMPTVRDSAGNIISPEPPMLSPQIMNQSKTASKQPFSNPNSSAANASASQTSHQHPPVMSQSQMQSNPSQRSNQIQSLSAQQQQQQQPQKRIFSKNSEMKPRPRHMPQASFKVENESSPYAFEAESSDPKTPYRTPKLDTKKKNSTHPSSSSSSNIQCNLENAKEMGSSIPIPAELATQLAAQAKKERPSGSNAEMTYFIPLQSSSGQSFGVAVKLGTEGPSGPNQKVIMKAKLVTQPTGKPVGARVITSKETESTCEPETSSGKKGKKRGVMHASPIIKSDDSDSDTSQPSTSTSRLNSPESVQRKKLKSSSRQSLNAEERDCCLGTVEVLDRFPKLGQHARLVEAPVYKPSEKDFKNPMKYIERIRAEAEPFGFCKIIPPKSFKPECNVDDDMRFTAYNQVIQKMMNRWGPNTKEMAAIRKYLETQNITIKTHPMVGGVEIDLPALYHAVQSFGGLTEVIQRKRWGKIAEYLRIPKGTQDRGNKLDDIYCKYLLPYDTLSPVEREELHHLVNEEFEERNKRKLDLSKDDDDCEEESSEDEDYDCVMKGKSTSLSAFYRVSRNILGMIFKQDMDLKEIEEEYWRIVMERDSHIQVQQGSIDAGDEGFGFPTSKTSSCGRHPWNLKILSNNPRSLLRCMGPVMGVTVPTLNVGMVFTSGCWYRDPHGLPIVEYHHTGASKVWYGVPDSQSIAFYTAMKQLVPVYCRKKNIWLPADTVMVPPNLLVKYGVSVCRTVQEPGQFLVIFPKTYNSYICTGYTISESVFYAPKDYLNFAESEFNSIRESSEPMMFPFPKLLLCIAQDEISTKETLQKVKPFLEKLRDNEYVKRTILADLGVKTSERIVLKRKKDEQDDEYECEVCSENLYISYVCDLKEDTYFCKEHAIEYLQDRKASQRKNCKLLYTHSKEEISAIIKMLNKRLAESDDESSSSSSDDEVTIKRIAEPKRGPTSSRGMTASSSKSSIQEGKGKKKPPVEKRKDIESSKSSKNMAEKKKPKKDLQKPAKSKKETKARASKRQNEEEEESSLSSSEEERPKKRKFAPSSSKPSTSTSSNVKRRKTKTRKAAQDKSGNLAVEILDMLLSASDEGSEESDLDQDSSDESWK